MYIKNIIPAVFVFLLFSMTAHAKTLVVYTYDSFTTEWGPGPQLAELFEKQCECQLKFVGLQDGGAILTRIKLEGTQSKADVIVGIDNHFLADIEEADILTEHGMSPAQPDALPIEWNHPTLLPYDFGWFAFVYNSEKVKHPPQRLTDLVNDNKTKPSLIIQDPRISTPGLGFLLWMKTIFGDRTDKAWQALSKKIVTVTPGWSEAYSLFLKGEADMVLSYTTSPAYHAIAENDARFKSVLFEEGNFIQIELAGVLRNSKNKKLAKQFLNFLIGESAQKIIPTTQWMFPVKNVALPAGFADNAIPKKTLVYPQPLTVQKKKSLLREWQTNLK